MSDSRDKLSANQIAKIDEIVDRFEAASRSEAAPRIEDYLAGAPELGIHLLLGLLSAEIQLRESAGETPSPEDYRDRFPDVAEWLDQRFSTERIAADEIAATDSALTVSLPASSEATRDVVTQRRVRYFGNYELLQELARGGMGVVYKATQMNLNRTVAIKFILSGNLAGEEEVARFKAEAEAAANLDHPGIVPIHEIGEHEGQHYFSMSFIEGQSLQDKLREGPLPPREAAELCNAIAQAVAYAHQKGVIHRDLKPANILLDADDQPRVTDFGLAKQVESDRDLTRSGAVMGTPNYMPPEQAAGKASEVGPAGDTYSLGAILYCLLTGRPPFQAATAVDTVMQVLQQEPVAPRTLNPQVPKDLDTICLKCLSKEVGKRYETADAFAADLRRYLVGEPIVARPTTRTERVWKWCKRNPQVTAMAVVTVLLLAGVASVISADRRRSLVQQIKTTVASLDTKRGIILPPLSTLEALPRETVLGELRRQFNADSDRQLSLSFALAHFGDLRRELLFSKVPQAHAEEAANFVNALEHDAQGSIEEINALASSISDNSVPSLRRRARLAMLALHLGDSTLAETMCQLRADPIERTVFIDECSTWLGDPIRLSQRADEIECGMLRSAICLAVGGATKTTVKAELEAVEKLLTDWHEHQPDSGTHSASGWALRQWGLPLPQLPVDDVAPDEARKSRIADLIEDVLELEQQVTSAESRRGERKREWEQQLSTDPEADLSDLSNGLFAHYSFDGDAPKRVANQVTGESDAAYIGPSTMTRSAGVVGNAWELTGNSFVDAGQAFQPEREMPFTIGCWFRQFAEADGNRRLKRGVLIAKHAAAEYRGFYLSAREDSLELRLSHNQRSRITVFGSFLNRVSRWHHAMATYDGTGNLGGVTLYLDGQRLKTNVDLIKRQQGGQAQLTRNRLAGVVATAAPLTIGNFADQRRGGYDFSGQIDEVRIYSRALNANEVVRHYRDGFRAIAAIPVGQRSAEQEDLMVRGHEAHDRVEEELHQQLRQAIAKVTDAAWEGLPDWHISPTGLTLIRLRDGEFVDPYREAVLKETRVQADEGFLISDREISLGLFVQFLKDPDYPAREKPARFGLRTDQTANHPVQGVNWCDAVMFCNWLSHREGLKKCYQRTGKKTVDIQLKETEFDDWKLEPTANGYRLPTSAEWEYACRAGSTTSYPFGDDDRWIDDYSVRRAESSDICGNKLPNGWGLFNMQGNVGEWCNDTSAFETGSRPELIGKPIMRVYRGGSYFANIGARSATIGSTFPSNRTGLTHCGFRVVVIPHKQYGLPR